MNLSLNNNLRSSFTAGSIRKAIAPLDAAYARPHTASHATSHTADPTAKNNGAGPSTGSGGPITFNWGNQDFQKQVSLVNANDGVLVLDRDFNQRGKSVDSGTTRRSANQATAAHRRTRKSGWPVWATSRVCSKPRVTDLRNGRFK